MTHSKSLQIIADALKQIGAAWESGSNDARYLAAVANKALALIPDIEAGFTTTPNAKAFIEKLLLRMEQDATNHFSCNSEKGHIVYDVLAQVTNYINQHRSEWK